MKPSHTERLLVYLEDYRNGVYSTNEVVGAILGILTDGVDFKILWADVPEWAKAPIREYLQDCDESSVIYNFSSKSFGPISVELLNLKNWLSSESGSN